METATRTTADVVAEAARRLRRRLATVRIYVLKDDPYDAGQQEEPVLAIVTDEVDAVHEVMSDLIVDWCEQTNVMTAYPITPDDLVSGRSKLARLLQECGVEV